MRCLTDQEKAEALANTFATQFSPNYLNDPEQDSVSQNTLKEIDEIDPSAPIVISPREVLEVIKGIPQRKTPGEDGIPSGAPRNLPLKLLVNLTTIFNAVLYLICYPSRWKCARIVPVPRSKKNHHSPEGYRPISLLCTISKVLETLLLTRISDNLNEHRLLDDDHLGFRSGHSTASQLFQITDHVTIAFNRKQIAVMVSLDLEMAFDKIRHERLLLKMKGCCFPARILKTVRTYLQNRSFNTVVNDNDSSARS
ncbi:hypothetical protein Trydic_g4669 [Trypoxylus dichotomus]